MVDADGDSTDSERASAPRNATAQATAPATAPATAQDRSAPRPTFDLRVVVGPESIETAGRAVLHIETSSLLHVLGLAEARVIGGFFRLVPRSLQVDRKNSVVR